MAHPSAPVRITITWEVTVSSISSGELEWARCQKCGAKLDLHQPDEDDPAHLLGTCGACATWHIIEVDSGGTGSLVFRLPDPDLDLVRAKLKEIRTTIRGGRRPRRDPRAPGPSDLEGQIA